MSESSASFMIVAGSRIHHAGAVPVSWDCRCDDTRRRRQALQALDAGQAILPAALSWPAVVAVSASMPSRHQLRRRFLVRRGVIYSLIISMLILLGGGFGFWLLDPGYTLPTVCGWRSPPLRQWVMATWCRRHASRAFAVIVVLLGLAVLSLVTASVAALFVEKDVHTEERAIERELMQEIRAVRAEVAALRRELGR